PAEGVLRRARIACTELDPACNPYLQWMLAGRHVRALPYALRPENVEQIRAKLARLEVKQCSIQEALAALGPRSVHRVNLSNTLEYLRPGDARAMLEQIARAGIPGGRLLYWDMI